jgi:ADP-heptose:LPS heptosyltransferase
MKFTYGVSSCITPIKKAYYFMKLVNPKHWVGLQKKGIYFDLLGDKYHFVEANLLAIKEICSISQEKGYPKLYADNTIVNQIMELIYYKEKQKGKKTIGICIGNADYSLKNRVLRTGKVYTRAWGIANFTNLITQLQSKNNYILLIGGKLELPLLAYVKEHLHSFKNIISFVGRTSMEESIAVISLCDCVIGVDTGMQHVAAALGKATVSIFGPTNPKTHGAYASNARFVEQQVKCKYCYGTKLYINCSNRECLKLIDCKDVYAKVSEII